MNAAARYAIRQFGRRRLRTLAGVVGVFLTIALLVAIQLGLDSVSTSYTDLVALQAGKADLLIRAPGGYGFQLEPFDPAEVRSKLAAQSALRGLAPRWIGAVQVFGSAASPNALLIGVDPELERVWELWGLEPEPRLEGAVCVVSKSLAARLPVEPGGTVSVSRLMGWGSSSLRVESVVERQRILPQEIRDFVVVPARVAQEILGEAGRVHLLAGVFNEPSAFYDTRDLHASVLNLKRAGETVAAELGPDYEVTLPKAAAITTFQNLASPLRAIFGVFAVLALCVTGLLIYSIVSVAVEERIREYAILRTLGARRRDLFRLVLGESLLLCGFGVVPGVLAGTVVARILVTLVELALHARVGSVALAVSGANLLLALGAGMLLSVGSALLPALQAGRWHIVDALDPLRRGQIRVTLRPEGAGHRTLLVTGVALSALSVVVFFVLPTAFLSGNSSLIGTVVLCLLLTILLGFTLVAVGALPWVESGVMRGLSLLLGPVAELARRNLDRHRRRNTTTSLMFILSVSLVIFVASLVVLFSQMSLTMVEHFQGADLRLQVEDGGSAGLGAELAGIRGVERVSEVHYLRSRTGRGTAYDVVLSDLVGMKHLWLVPFGVDAELPRVLYTNHIRYAEGGADGLERVARYGVAGPGLPSAGEEPPLVLSLAAARYLDVRAGDPVQLVFHLGADRRAQRFRVAAICATLPGFENFRSRVANAIGSGVLMPLSSYQALTRDVPDEARLVRYLLRVGGGEAGQQAAAAAIRERFDFRFQFGVRAVAEQQREARVVYWATQVFFGLLLAVAVLIAVFALIASMATSVIERRWEMGMLRALGLRRSQLFRMFLGEALGLTLSAGLAGGAIGFTLAWLFVLEAGSLAEIPVVFTLPYVTFLATFLISVTAGVVAAYLPTRRLLRRTPAEILRQSS